MQFCVSKWIKRVVLSYYFTEYYVNNNLMKHLSALKGITKTYTDILVFYILI